MEAPGIPYVTPNLTNGNLSSSGYASRISGIPRISEISEISGKWWHTPLLALIALIAIAETWGAIYLGKMVYQASNMPYTNGIGFTRQPRPNTQYLFNVARAYPSVIVGEMIQVMGPLQQMSIRMTLLVSPSKIEQNVVSDSLSGSIKNLIVDAYVGRISDIKKDPKTGEVTIVLVDMKIDDEATPPSMFYPLQYASSFQGTTNGTVVTTMFGC